MRILFALLLISSSLHAQLQTYELSKLDSINFQKFIDTKKVIIIGEMHGTAEVPQFVLQLAQQLKVKKKPLTVGLEIESNYQKDIDEYILTGDFKKLIAIDYFKTFDGRTSIAMGQLIKGLREMKGVKITCFDIPQGSGRDVNRDSLMGVNLSHAYQGDRMIILTGNLHANLKEGYWRPEFKSAAFYFNKISHLNDQLLSLNTCFGGGTIWNCMKDGCKEREAYTNTELKQYGTGDFIGVYDQQHPSGYSGFIYFNKVTASLPVAQ